MNVAMPTTRCAATLGGLLAYLMVNAPMMICTKTMPNATHANRIDSLNWRRCRYASAKVVRIKIVRTGRADAMCPLVEDRAVEIGEPYPLATWPIRAGHTRIVNADYGTPDDERKGENRCSRAGELQIAKTRTCLTAHGHERLPCPARGFPVHPGKM